MERTVRYLCFVLVFFATSAAEAGTRTYVGAGNPTTAWDKAANWSPSGVPTADDTVYVPFANPYVEITASTCVAHTVVIQSGGRLVLKGGNNGRVLTIAHDLIIEAGGTFNTTGATSNNGTVVYIGGNVVNCGVWDLGGVSQNNPGVVFNGVGTQTISGTSPLTFQNLTNNPNDSLIIDGVNVGILGRVDPPTGINLFAINGGSCEIGGPPMLISLVWFTAVSDTATPQSVLVQWQTLNESTVLGFTVERRAEGAPTFDSVAWCAPAGAAPYVYAYLDGPVTPGAYFYRLRALDTLARTVVSDSVAVTVDFPPLSISLAWFSAVPDTSDFQTALVRWQTLEESTSLGFTLERRAEGALTFDSVAWFAPAGAAPNVYTFPDGPLAPGVWYYRLRTVDTFQRVVVFDSAAVTIAVPEVSIVLAWFSAVPDTSAAGYALVRWQMTNELTSLGFTVERRAESAPTFDSVAWFAPAGAAPNVYTFSDGPLAPGAWYYRLRTVDSFQRVVVFDSAGLTIEPVSSVEDQSPPTAFRLLQNYPNPFNPATIIRFDVAASGHVRLSVYDMAGREVAVLADGQMPAGRHAAWFDGSRLASGAYLYRLTTVQGTFVRRMTLVK